VRSGDSQRFNLDLVNDGPQIIEDICADAVARKVEFSTFFRTKIRSKPCITYTSYPETIVLRTIAAYLARRFRIAPANRDRVVAGAIEGMMDATPYWVIRRDVSSFYESIDAGSLRERLIYDTSIPRSVRYYLARFFDTHCPPGTRGLPRGIGLTAVLAELAMEKFDQQVRALPGVYRYFRYSDDIVIFAYDNVSKIEKALEALLPNGMVFNKKKCDTVDFTGRTPGVKAFEYLGYRLSTTAGIGGKDARPVEVTISSAKVARLKTRIILTLKAFQRNHDGKLLIDRLRLLSSNYQVNRRGISAWLRGKRVRSGIYYNYRRCGRYVGSDFVEQRPTELADLDKFTHTLLKSPRSRFHNALTMHLTAAQRTTLKTISFSRGFTSRRLIRVPYKRLAKLKEAWRNA
jgi:hypothetical protein